MSALLKNPRRESVEIDDDDTMMPPAEENGDPDSRQDQEDALIALIEHRAQEVEHNRRRREYYQSKLVEAEKRLNESQTKLARLRSQNKAASTKVSPSNGIKSVKEERRSMSPIPLRSRPQSKTELLIPAVTPKVSQPPKVAGSSGKAQVSSSSQASPAVSSQSISASKEKGDKSYRSSSKQDVEVQDKGTKRKFEEKEHKELIPMVRTSSKPSIIQCHSNNHISSHHKRKLRCLYMCPVNDQLFATSALDGLVNLWEVQGRGSGASLLSTTDCQSPKQRRWPEDIAWHPHGNSLFSVYTADGGESQVSVLNLNRTQGKPRVTFLEAKPHVKGIINSIVFPPWENTCFVTGGSDHAVVLWKETDAENVWKPKQLHRSIHSSAVMGVAGMWQKQIILSVGADKRIVGFNANMERTEFKHQIDSKCMSVLPNPCDFNLFMVQAGTHEKQLRLYDIRLRQTEIHAFGWKQESSDSQSALINQAWSPDGLYISSGTADPMIHIFDIRYNAQKPSQSIKAHQKRVFKAVWLCTSPFSFLYPLI
ncbi:putative transcription factor WD40-like family [Rosa chinensis]|uniref:Putative transcription factor WD40-like family n=1 Tax=Rosa chinensis TaxID=74649 RepID=A0A2P6P4K3_ROSCH|nr:putative transcription factor WD40-like family [Rosa chinensis]